MHSLYLYASASRAYLGLVCGSYSCVSNCLCFCSGVGQQVVIFGPGGSEISTKGETSCFYFCVTLFPLQAHLPEGPSACALDSVTISRGLCCPVSLRLKCCHVVQLSTQPQVGPGQAVRNLLVACSNIISSARPETVGSADYPFPNLLILLMGNLQVYLWKVRLAMARGGSRGSLDLHDVGVEWQLCISSLTPLFKAL